MYTSTRLNSNANRPVQCRRRAVVILTQASCYQTISVVLNKKTFKVIYVYRVKQERDERRKFRAHANFVFFPSISLRKVGKTVFLNLFLEHFTREHMISIYEILHDNNYRSEHLY